MWFSLSLSVCVCVCGGGGEEEVLTLYGHPFSTSSFSYGIGEDPVWQRVSAAPYLVTHFSPICMHLFLSHPPTGNNIHMEQQNSPTKLIVDRSNSAQLLQHTNWPLFLSSYWWPPILSKKLSSTCVLLFFFGFFLAHTNKLSSFLSLSLSLFLDRYTAERERKSSRRSSSAE